MKQFRKYLKAKSYGEKSIERKIKHLRRYEKWLRQNSYQKEQIDYPKALWYLDWERKGGIADVTLNHYLNHVKHYYDYLMESKQINTNPYQNIQLKKKLGSAAPLYLQDLLTTAQLDQIYQAYQANPRLNQRDKIQLSLLIYQGLATAELSHLKVRHVNLQKAQINIPPSKSYAQRILPLQAIQILPLARFTENKTPDQILISYRSQSQASNSRTHLCQQINRELKKQRLNIPFSNLRQIRRSVIAQWVKHENLRQAQYLAGHRSVQSTERYQVQSIEQLIEEVGKYHPLG